MEEQALLWVNGLHNEFFDAMMYAIASKWVWVPLYTVLVVVIARTTTMAKAVLFIALVVLAIVLADQISASILRPLLHRLRPSNPENPISQYIHIVNGDRGGRYGLPSCHAANVTALLAMLCMWIKDRKTLIAMGLWVLIICYSRMYLGRHYPGDILLGMTVGVSTAFICSCIYRKAYKRIYDEKAERLELRDDLLVPATWVLTLIATAVYAFFC